MNMSSKKNKNNKKILLPIKKEIAARLRQVRKDKGMTQRDTGEVLGINFQHVSKYERAEFVPTFENLIKLIKHFSININWLLTGHGPMYLKPMKEYAVAEDRLPLEKVREEDTMLQEIIEALVADETLKTKVYRYVKNYLQTQEAAEDLKHPEI